MVLIPRKKFAIQIKSTTVWILIFYKAANNRYSAVNNHIAEGKYSASDSHIFLSNKFETMVSLPLAHFQVQMRFFTPAQRQRWFILSQLKNFCMVTVWGSLHFIFVWLIFYTRNTHSGQTRHTSGGISLLILRKKNPISAGEM